MLTLPNRTLPQHVSDVHHLLSVEDRERLQLLAADFSPEWEQGRLGTGYFKARINLEDAKLKTLFGRVRLAIEAFIYGHELGDAPGPENFDAWLVFFPPHSFAARHRDVVENGAKHVRLVAPLNGYMERLRLHGVRAEPVCTPLAQPPTHAFQHLAHTVVSVQGPLPTHDLGVEVDAVGDGFVFAPSEIEHELPASKYSRLFYTVGAKVGGDE